MTYQIRFYIVVAKDSNGVGTAIASQDFQPIVQSVNSRWASFGVEFLFDTADLEVVHNTLLRDDTTVGDFWANARERSRFASRHLGHLVVFIRDYPPLPGTGLATNFSGSGDFIVVAPPLSDGVLAHELGHFFNCEHTMSVVELHPQERSLPTSDQVDLLRTRFATAIRGYVSAGHSKADGLNTTALGLGGQ